MKPKGTCVSVVFRLVLWAFAVLLTASASYAADKKPAPAKPAPARPAAAPKAAPAHTAGTPAGRGSGGGTATPGAAGRGAAPGGAGRGVSGQGRGATGAATPAGNRAGANPMRRDSPGPGGRPTNMAHTPRAPVGGREFHSASGNSHATFDRAGRPRDVQARDINIHHGPNGRTVIVRERPGHVMVVSNHYGHGFVAHPYRYGGVEYVHRTYYYNGVVYSRIYRPYVWGGVPINVYMPAYYYPRAYYGWAYNPWGAPVVYTAWGWGGSPWYGYYGGWFTPYPTYAGPAFWLTDYIMAQTLMAAYQERAADAAAMSFTEPMPPYVKNLVAEEVRRQIALENSEAAGGAQAQPDPGSSGIARMLSDGQSHVFVVANSLDVNSTSGECFVTEGDVLQLQGSVAAGAASANLSVLASKGKDCAKGSVVQVQIADLQDMQNHMRETVDQGLNELKNKQGQNGIPPVPDSAKGEGQKTAFAAIAPPPDPNVKTELSETSKEAVEAEAEVLHEASGPSADTTDPPPPPPQSGAKKSVESGQTGKKSVELGQTIDEVVSILGPPKNIVDLGSTKIYLYDLMKFTFKDGKLTKSE